ncbi:MAG: hypothetical protein Q8N53_15360, partial [Longimicrobiales bacterium]|nr:hypothetical protein [Longimicrobiales bacterium]
KAQEATRTESAGDAADALSVGPQEPPAPPRTSGPRVEEAKPGPPSDWPIRPRWTRWRFERGDWSDEAVRDSAELRALRDALHGWARSYLRPSRSRRHVIDIAWILDAALDTLTHVDQGCDSGRFNEPRFIDIAEGPPFVFTFPVTPSENRRRRQLIFDGLKNTASEATRGRAKRAARSHFGPVPTFEHEPWFPQWKTAERYQADVREAFEQRLDDAGREERRTFKVAVDQYMQERETHAQTSGLEPSPEMRADSAERAKDDHARRNFRRLARKCAGEETAVVAAEEGVSVRAVQRSNKRTAERLGVAR